MKKRLQLNSWTLPLPSTRLSGPGFWSRLTLRQWRSSVPNAGWHLPAKFRSWPRITASPLGVAYRADLIVESKVLVEVKAVTGMIEAHAAQALSYLRFSGLRLGLLINFSTPLMKQGIKRIVN